MGVQAWPLGSLPAGINELMYKKAVDKLWSIYKVRKSCEKKLTCLNKLGMMSMFKQVT